MEGVGYAHPHNEREAETAIHWARLVAKNDPNTITILTIFDNKWYQNHTPHIGPFQDTHVIAHIPTDTITYEEPTIPIEMNKPRVESASIHILCVHHNNNNIGNIEQINTLTTILNNLHIPQIYIQIAPPTPPNTQVNKSKKWNALTYPTTNISQYVEIPPLPNYENNNSLNFPPQYCYYTDGSFLPPQQIGDRWIREKVGYGVYNQHKNLELAARLPGLQNIFRAELMAIHTTLKIIQEEYPNESAHIFTDCLNGLYVIKTQIKHLTLHNNHPDKTILQEIVKLLQQRTQHTTLYKVRAHANILGNEKADELAKVGREKEHTDAINPYEFAHSTPYYYQKDWWHSMNETLDKGPIRFLEKHLIKHDRKYNLEIIAIDFPNIDKWIANADIDNELSNEYWTNKHITDSQKTCLLKLRHGQYMGNARKQLFFGREIYPSITCSICNSLEPDTWLHVLLNCRQRHIQALRTKRHNKAVWALRKLLVSSKHCRCYIHMNAGTFNENPPENTVPPWLLPCTCDLQRCHCNARFKPDIICVKGLSYQANSPTTPVNNLKIQFIEFTYYNDRFSSEAITRKTEKYQPLIVNITNRGWNVEPL